MARFAVGDTVRVSMPKGPNKRGVVGVSVLFSTYAEARFDGAVGTVVEIDPRSTLGLPQYLVNFRGHKNRVAIPWQSQWFRGEWLVPAPAQAQAQPDPAAGAQAGTPAGGTAEAATGAGQTTTRGSS
ncbi:MAG: hypothetical protein M3Q71_11785 [Chloroflexota bacterium]|nr:hypothetical protein [Chloroflexota bacterium]